MKKETKFKSAITPNIFALLLYRQRSFMNVLNHQYFPVAGVHGKSRVSFLNMPEQHRNARFWPNPAVRFSIACCQHEKPSVGSDRPHATKSRHTITGSWINHYIDTGCAMVCQHASLVDRRRRESRKSLASRHAISRKHRPEKTALITDDAACFFGIAERRLAICVLHRVAAILFV